MFTKKNRTIKNNLIKGKNNKELWVYIEHNHNLKKELFSIRLQVSESEHYSFFNYSFNGKVIKTLLPYYIRISLKIRMFRMFRIFLNTISHQM